MRTIAVAALATSALATSALAQAQSRPEIVRGLCQKDGCDEFSVAEVERIRADEDGTLLRTRLRTYRASSQGRTETGEEAGYVFCSPTRPTILAESEGRIAGLQIATFPTQESRETIRRQSNYYAMYFTLCHGPEGGRAAVRDLYGAAQQFGYRSPLPKSVMVTYAQPEEVFPTADGVGRMDARSAGPGERGAVVPPQPIPDARSVYEPSVRPQRFVERQVGEEDETVIIERRRPSPESTPWFREPQRWIERLIPF
jgi:hypothetical protein